MQSDTTIIDVKGLEKSFKDVDVLKGINISIAKGSIFALLGSNGAGKTTTVRILSTLIKPTSGKAAVCGYDVVKQANKVRGSISLTGQYAAVDESLTGNENMRMIGSLRHLKNYSQDAYRLLNIFDLSDAANRRVSTYSGGMRRKLDLAMSLLGNPPVIFLDEPTTGLDPQNRLAMWEIIREMADSGTTVFLTTQYLEEAENLADHIAILNNGKIVAEGTPSELKNGIPHGTVELTFNRNRYFRGAIDLLKNYQIKPNDENRTIDIMTDGSVEQLLEILNKLKDSDVSISGFAQKLPTLEDVFLTLIDIKKENTNEK